MTTRLSPERALTQWYMQRASVVKPGSVGSPVESPNPVRVCQVSYSVLQLMATRWQSFRRKAALRSKVKL